MWGVWMIVLGVVEIPKCYAAFFIGLLVCGLTLSFGGPTGLALNPARDLGPRIIHAILPIQNKGDSDWSYAWIPVIAPLLGAMFTCFIALMLGII